MLPVLKVFRLRRAAPPQRRKRAGVSARVLNVVSARPLPRGPVPRCRGCQARRWPRSGATMADPA